MRFKYGRDRENLGPTAEALDVRHSTSKFLKSFIPLCIFPEEQHHAQKSVNEISSTADHMGSEMKAQLLQYDLLLCAMAWTRFVLGRDQRQGFKKS